MKRLFRLLIFLIVFAETLSAKVDSIPSKSFYSHLDFSFETDYVASSINDVLRPAVKPAERISTHFALPVSISYSFSFTNPDVRYFLKDGYQGIGVNVLNLGNVKGNASGSSVPFIGFPATVFIYQGGPFLNISKKLSLGYEWRFGASFGWKSYSESNDCLNIVVGSRVNAYLNAAVYLDWAITPALSLRGGLSLSHFSNGNTSWPNPGINLGGARVGLVYEFGKTNITEDKAFSNKEIDSDEQKEKPWNFNITLWSSLRKRAFYGDDITVLRPGNFLCAGIGLSPLWSMGKHWGLGPSLDVELDRSADMKRNYISGTTTEDVKFRNPSIWRQISVGLSVHGELRMPIFTLNAGVGWNLLAPGEDKGSYLNIAVKTYVCRWVYLNVGYQLRNFYQQSSLMLGAGISI